MLARGGVLHRSGRNRRSRIAGPTRRAVRVEPAELLISGAVTLVRVFRVRSGENRDLSRSGVRQSDSSPVGIDGDVGRPHRQPHRHAGLEREFGAPGGGQLGGDPRILNRPHPNAA